MTELLLGLLLFLGVHSVRIMADDWRSQSITRWGKGAWMVLYSVASLAGLLLVVRGFSAARMHAVYLWHPPMAMRHIAALLTLLAFVLFVAAYVPRNAIKARLHHPMVLGVKLWALAHLLANGNLAHGVLFGSFLLWAVLSFKAARGRDKALAIVYPAGTVGGTALTVVLGALAWAVFAFWAHGAWIGVRPLG